MRPYPRGRVRASSRVSARPGADALEAGRSDPGGEMRRALPRLRGPWSKKNCISVYVHAACPVRVRAGVCS